MADTVAMAEASWYKTQVQLVPTDGNESRKLKIWNLLNSLAECPSPAFGSQASVERSLGGTHKGMTCEARGAEH